jgi:hypothetical protein
LPGTPRKARWRDEDPVFPNHESYVELVTTYERLGRFSRRALAVLRVDLFSATMGTEVLA